MLERVAIIAAARVFALGVAVAATAGPSVTRLRKAAAGWGGAARVSRICTDVVNSIDSPAPPHSGDPLALQRAR
jgi:hypothetical protein